MIYPARFKLNTSSFQYYWTKGLGLPLLEKLGHKPDLKAAERYVPYLFEYDAPADKLIQQLHQKLGFIKAQALFAQYLQNSDSVEAEYRQALDQFFTEVHIDFSWVDWDLINLGSSFCQRSGISGLIVLRDYCLMGGYESSAINKPLIYTGALRKGAVKRISETTVFWVDITDKDAMRCGHKGFKAALETRMIHAFARVNILKDTDWDTQKWGIPLNQWDMLATNLGFSMVYLVGLRRMGIQASKAEVKGLFHLWKLVGYLLGIPLHLIPETEEQAIKALYYWTMTQAEGDDDTRALAKALQEEPLIAFYPPNVLGRKLMREIHLYYNHYLLGEYSCRILGLDQTRLGYLGHLNILRNKWQHTRLNNEKQRQKAIQKGRQEHEEVKRIYLQHKLRHHATPKNL